MRGREQAALTGGVYFIEAAGLKKVKIGYAVDVKKRLATLAIGCPVPLKLVAHVKGPRSLEFDLHMKFFDAWSHGEWFKMHKALAAFIEQNRIPAQALSAVPTPSEDP